MSRVWFACAVVLAIVSASSAYEVFEPVQDSYVASYELWQWIEDELVLIEEAWKDENYGDSLELHFLAYYIWSTRYVEEAYKDLVIKFDLSTIEPETRVLQAVLKFYCLDYNYYFSVIYDLYLVEDGWEEMNVTFNNKPSKEYIEDGDIYDIVEGEYFSIDLPVNVVENWINESNTNFGFYFHMVIYMAEDFLILASRESEYPPLLELVLETDDTETPACAEVFPVDGESEVPPDVEIEFTLTDDLAGIDTDTIQFTLTLEDERAPDGQSCVSVGAESNTLIEGSLDIDDEDPLEVVCTFTPDDDLPWGAYACTVDGSLADLLGKEMGEDYVWTFDTYGYDDDPPEVTDLNPEDGETDVPPDSIITFHLTDGYAGVDVYTIEFSIRDEFYRPSSSNIKGALSQSGYSPLGEIEGDLEVDSTDLFDVVCTFTPYQDLPPSIITCTVGGSLADRDGNALGEDYVWTFTVHGAAVDEKSWGEIKAEF